MLTRWFQGFAAVGLLTLSAGSAGDRSVVVIPDHPLAHLRYLRE